MEVLEAIKMRRSVRAYAKTPIPPISISRMMKALRFAPSACNYQPWHFIFVTDPALRRRVAEASNRQLFMADAPVIVVACGWPEQAYKRIFAQAHPVQADGNHGDQRDHGYKDHEIEERNMDLKPLRKNPVDGYGDELIDQRNEEGIDQHHPVFSHHLECVGNGIDSAVKF